MTNIELSERIKHDEYIGERLINKFRFALGLIFLTSVLAISIIRKTQGESFFPLRAYSFTSLFFLYSVALFIYLKIKTTLHRSFKYITSSLDMILISAAIWMGCTYLEEAPPLPFLSIQALFYIVLILAGAFRYSIKCAYFSGVFSSVCYLIVVVVNRNVLDLPYFYVLESSEETFSISFPIYNEFFRTLGMLVAGVVTGMACKRQLALFNGLIKSKTAAAESASRTLEQTRSMAETINKSTDDIFLSSKDIFSTANNQATSIQEIESTINENAQIAGEISDKTSNVAAILSKMENDVIHGFQLLERNVSQLEDIKLENDGVLSGISELKVKILKIHDIIVSINAITDQTKVIAFNAALEAASAGDRGKRFAVVASEVNRLADDITALTKQIRQQVEGIQSSSSALVTSGEKSAHKITEGNNLIKELENVFHEIRSGAEVTANQAQTITVSTIRQQKSTEQINIAIADIAKGLSKFIQSTRIATSSAEGLTEMIHELNTILTEKSTEGEET